VLLCKEVVPVQGPGNTTFYLSTRHVRKEVFGLKLTKQLISKFILGFIVLALVAGFAVAYVGPAVASAQTTTPTTSPTPKTTTGTKKANYKNFAKFKRKDFRPAVKTVLDAAAKALTITTDDLKTQLKAGKSIADVAASKQINLQTVKDAILAAVKSELDARVTAKKITQAQADARYKKVSDNIDKLVNAKFTGHTHHKRTGKNK